jgi:hypothetical protein
MAGEVYAFLTYRDARAAIEWPRRRSASGARDPEGNLWSFGTYRHASAVEGG